MATWSDFTLVGSTTGTGAGTLTVSGVQANDLIIACSAVRTPYTYYSPALPSHAPGGVDTTEVFSKNSIPQEGSWYWHPKYNWHYWYYPYYGYYWWWWRHKWWYYRYPLVLSRISIYRADAAGDVSVTFSEPSGWGAIFSTYLRVWKPNIGVGEYEAVRSIMFAESAQGAQAIGTTASMAVTQDDLLLAGGVDSSSNPVGDFTLSGPSAQELVDFNPIYANRTSRFKLWRIKSTTTATVNYTRCNEGRMLMKINPSVDTVQTSRPVVVDPSIYIEIRPEMTSSGRVIRPRWFENLRTTYAWSHEVGLRKRWLKEATSTDEGEKRAGLVELWKFPNEANASVPEGAAFTFVEDATAEARVLHHDLGW